MDLYKRIKIEMAAQDMTISQLAEKIGMTQSTLSKKLASLKNDGKNETRFRYCEVEQIANIFGCTLEFKDIEEA